VHYGRWWARQRGIYIGRVVTQGANHRACALYEACGYRLERAENVYHFWL
jgi:hypothetical protein